MESRKKIRNEAHRIWRSKYSLWLLLLVAGPKGATERLKTCRGEARGRTSKRGREKKRKTKREES